MSNYRICQCELADQERESILWCCFICIVLLVCGFVLFSPKTDVFKIQFRVIVTDEYRISSCKMTVETYFFHVVLNLIFWGLLTHVTKAWSCWSYPYVFCPLTVCGVTSQKHHTKLHFGCSTCCWINCWPKWQQQSCCSVVYKPTMDGLLIYQTLFIEIVFSFPANNAIVCYLLDCQSP